MSKQRRGPASSRPCRYCLVVYLGEVSLLSSQGRDLASSRACKCHMVSKQRSFEGLKLGANPAVCPLISRGPASLRQL